MSPLSLRRPTQIPVNRSQLREKQSSILSKARGHTVVVVTARQEEDEKYVVDKAYFEAILKHLRTATETLKITADTKLFSQLLKVRSTIDEDIRHGRLHSLEEAFGED